MEGGYLQTTTFSFWALLRIKFCAWPSAAPIVGRARSDSKENMLEEERTAYSQKASRAGLHGPFNKNTGVTPHKPTSWTRIAPGEAVDKELPEAAVGSASTSTPPLDIPVEDAVLFLDGCFPGALF